MGVVVSISLGKKSIFFVVGFSSVALYLSERWKVENSINNNDRQQQLYLYDMSMSRAPKVTLFDRVSLRLCS